MHEKNTHDPANCPWCNGHQRTLPLGMCRMHAAAPDMYEVLKTILARFDMEPTSAVFPCSAMRDDIRAALAKAEGGKA